MKHKRQVNITQRSDVTVGIGQNKYILRGKNLVHSKWLWVGLIAIILTIIGLILWGQIRNNKNSSTIKVQSKEATSKLVSMDDSTANQKYLVQQFSSEFTADYEQVSNSNPNEWSRVKLDKAYLCLLYADKIGSFSQVDTTLYLIGRAQKSGLNIDDNSYGVNQTIRNTIKQRATAQEQALIKRSTNK